MRSRIAATDGRFTTRPTSPRLSSRIPYGEKVSPGKLGMIEVAENVLRDLGFFDVRVRHHELPATSFQVPGQSLRQEAKTSGNGAVRSSFMI